MTLLVALKAEDGLVLAADSRGTFGDPRGVTAQNDSQKKAHVLSKHVAVLLAGSGELGAMLVRNVEAKVQAEGLDGVTNVSSSFREVARQCYGEWFPHLPPAAPPGIPQMSRPDIQAIVAGFDPGANEAFDQARIIQLLSGLDFPPMLHEYGFALAGVAQYALYLLNRLYEPGRTVAELSALAVYAITETASQDGKVGGQVRLITITPQAGCVEVQDSEVERIIRQNGQRARKWRASFYGPRRA
jgi:20S proteasome alpha/beta subunit